MSKRIPYFFFFLLILANQVQATISLPRLISDGMILQRNEKVKIWGWASPGEEVAFTFNQKTWNTTADKDGKWSFSLLPQKAGGPYVFKFSGSNELAVKDIYFGDVWLCSGQSNMELTMERVKEKYHEEVTNASNNLIRQFLVPDLFDFQQSFEDLEDGSWVSVTPESIMGFTAVGYFFAKSIQEKTGAPVGLINAALGGSPVESWMSESALKPFPESYQELQKFKDDALIARIRQEDRDRSDQWYREINAKDKGLKNNQPQWIGEDYPDGDWEDYEIPGFWADQSIGDMNGVIWFRKKVVVPESMTGKVAKLWMGRIVDQDFVYLNGKMVGTTGYQYPPRRYPLEPGALKAGENTIAIRVINNAGSGGFVFDKPYYIATDTDTLSLEGTWKAKVGGTMERLVGQTFIRWKPGGLYNKMIHPLHNYAIKGAIWYQGESNAGNPHDYQEKLSTMITDWRERWGLGDFPFIIVQLANFLESHPEPTESNWAELRQQQLQTLEVDNTGLAVIIDVGEGNDIHPLNKKTVGDRLGAWAGKLAYGEKKAPVSPLPGKETFRGNQVVIQFEYAPNGLVAKGGTEIKHLAISGNGKDFVWAKSRIEGNKLFVWHESIQEPVAVRYAWADNPETANLYSAEGVPVTPFGVEKDDSK